jgi:hypothetical protein
VVGGGLAGGVIGGLVSWYATTAASGVGLFSKAVQGGAQFAQAGINGASAKDQANTLLNGIAGSAQAVEEATKTNWAVIIPATLVLGAAGAGLGWFLTRHKQTETPPTNTQ